VIPPPLSHVPFLLNPSHKSLGSLLVKDTERSGMITQLICIMEA
jgi:hypothetical protein